MRFYLITFSVLVLIIFGSSCRKDFDYPVSNGNLEFSKDTVYLDTIFSTIASSTRTLKVYNNSSEDFEIPSIRLSQGQNSSYRLNVDGESGKEFNNIPLLSKDSLHIFIETTFDISTTSQNEFLNTDVIQFDYGNNLQEVQLVSLVKDAIFLYPNSLTDGSKETISIGLNELGNEIRVEGFDLDENQLNFTNQKPYVIYGYAAVPEGKELIIDAGTRVHFHKNSGLLVKANASLQIQGELSENQALLEKEVVFEGDRLEGELSKLAGQWGSLWIASGSKNNTIQHLTLKNATVGLLVEGDGLLETTTLSISNSQIYNSASINLWAKTAAVKAQNLVIGSSGNGSLYCNLGGSYEFVHCTIANYWNNGFRPRTAVQIDNFSASSMGDLQKAEFINSIIDGNSSFELALLDNGTNQFEYSFTNCLLKFNDTNNQFESNPLYNFENVSVYTDIILNEEANFNETSKNDFRIGNPSALDNVANLETAQEVPLDILGFDRTISPTIGAYQISQ